MDLRFISSINWSTVAAFIAGIWGMFKQVDKWLMEHQQTIDAIILRIEKDSKGGWSNDEKKAFAVDMYNQYIKSEIKWYLRPFVKWFVLPKIEKLIEGICTKSHKLKGKVPVKPR
nr:hypothetical protein 31 [Elusimicrobiota bacterium]